MKRNQTKREFSMHYCQGLHQNVVVMTEHKVGEFPHKHCMSENLCKDKHGCEHTESPMGKNTYYL